MNNLSLFTSSIQMSTYDNWAYRWSTAAELMFQCLKDPLQQTNKQKKYKTKPTKINFKLKKPLIRSKIREYWPGYLIKLVYNLWCFISHLMLFLLLLLFACLFVYLFTSLLCCYRYLMPLVSRSAHKVLFSVPCSM